MPWMLGTWSRLESNIFLYDFVFALNTVFLVETFCWELLINKVVYKFYLNSIYLPVYLKHKMDALLYKSAA